MPVRSAINGTTDLALLIRKHHWNLTELGPVGSWSEVLSSTVNLLLSFPVAAALYWGPSMRMIYNDPYVAILGDKHPNALGTRASEIWAEVWDLVSEKYEETWKAGVSRREERVLIPIRHSGGPQDLYWDYVISPVWEGGRVAGILTIAQDVTDQVRTTNALIESDERLRLAMSAGDCIGTWDWHVQTDRVYSEQRFALMFGANPELASRGVPLSAFFERIHPADRTIVEKAIVFAMESGEDYVAEYRLLQADGSARWVKAKGRCIYAENGLPLRFPGIVFDITARKEAESQAGRKMAATSPNSSSPPAISGLSRAGGPVDEPLDRREEVIQTLDALLKDRHNAGKLSANIPAEGILNLLCEGLLLEQHLAKRKPVPVGALADSILRSAKQHAEFRKPYLVNELSERSQRNAYLADLLQAVWIMLGETLRSTGFTSQQLLDAMSEKLRPEQ